MCQKSIIIFRKTKKINEFSISELYSKIQMPPKNRSHIIYTRISKVRQDSTLSTSVQFGKINEHLITKKGIVAKQHLSEVGSAYNSVPKLLNDVCCKLRKKNEGIVLAVYDTTRFSRNVEEGKALLKRLHENHSALLVCNSIAGTGELHSDSPAQRRQILDEIEMAENESRNLGRRVAQSVATLKGLGVFFGKKPPYGKKIEKCYILSKMRNVLSDDENEMKIVRFISKSVEEIASGCGGGSGGKKKKKCVAISSTSIKPLIEELNDGESTFRGKEWTVRNVKKVNEMYPHASSKCQCGSTDKITNCKECFVPQCETCMKKNCFSTKRDGWKCGKCIFSGMLLSS